MASQVRDVCVVDGYLCCAGLGSLIVGVSLILLRMSKCGVFVLCLGHYNGLFLLACRIMLLLG